jgi:transcriptional regulator with XRE-family HTH domain
MLFFYKMVYPIFMNRRAQKTEKHDSYRTFERVQTEELDKLLDDCSNVEDFVRAQVAPYQGVDLPGYLTYLIECKGLTRAEVIRRAGMSESYAYQIFAGEKQPSRDKLLALAVGVGMSADECRRALKLAGHSELYIKNRRDAAIAFGLRRGLDVYDINDLLYQMQEPILVSSK